MSSTTTYGRNRQSIVDLEREIDDLFRRHPQSTSDDGGDPTIPGHALVDILRTFSHNHNALELMTREEEEQLIDLIETNPGLAVTPRVLLAFIAQRTTAGPGDGREGTPEDDAEAMARARQEDLTEYEHDNHSRSSSPESIGTSVYRPPSRSSSAEPPLVPPKTPMRDSPFDATRRRRTTPLSNAPTSWTRRPPPQRRSSDAGAPGRDLSDSETSISAPPVAYSRSQGSTAGRVRSPSNPTSPDPYFARQSGSASPVSVGSYSRPHSRSRSHGHFSSLDGFALRHRSVSPESDGGGYYHHHRHHHQQHEHATTGLMSPPPSDRDMSDLSFEVDDRPLSALPLPSRARNSDDEGLYGDDDDDDDDPTLLRLHERLSTTSTVSLDMAERAEALQRVNDELRRKLSDTEDNLQRRLAEREAEIEDMHLRLDELRSELGGARRQEKELKAKERSSFTQIQGLEQSIAQLSRSLENSRLAYQNLNLQYAEQC
ncbi:uncharacterized protein PHACADRAFT_203123, partial [Phanerochaete carnosa HHB-10118-sp]